MADRLGALTGEPVPLAPAVVGPQVRDLTERLEPGQMLMLENVHFEAGESRNEPALASALAELADLYVGDAFAAAYLPYASTWGVAQRLPCAAGRLMEREVHALTAIVERPARPLVTLFGGAQIGEKLDLVWRFLELADVVCVGGAVCFPFHAAMGHGVGRSLCPVNDVEAARLALGGANGSSDRLALPKDLLLGRWGPNGKAARRLLDGVDVPDGWMGLDIGPGTASSYSASIAAAATVFWNGPMGRFELPQFAAGTRAVADAVASTSATTVVGGGETAQTLRMFGSQDRVDHLTVGGPAMHEFLIGRELPGVQVLLRDAVSLA